ncbi:MAG: type IV secretion system DNA-binding domain-containing protein [Candidatus Pacebacteria bacterium]|nr:type IV secretion system DNA-binding domain-containing protein [Candidatus Paceibacterota bacterium]
MDINQIIEILEKNSVYFYLELIAGALVIYFLLLLFLNSKKKRSRIKQALKMSLFSIKVPGKTFEELQIDPKKQEKEWISIMEHFYASLIALKKKNIFDEDPWISFELMKVKDQINFYIAAPERYEAFIEKQIYSIIPDADVQKVPDFNIFGPNEIVHSGFLKLEKSFYLPIKTYAQMESDPLSNLTHILTQIKEGEEGGIQIIVKNGPSTWKERGKRVLDELAKGKSFYQAMSDTGLSSLFKDQEKERERLAQNPQRVNEMLVKALESKLSKNDFEANIRIFVSGRDEASAEYEFHQIASIFNQFSSPDLNSFKIFNAKGGQARKLAFNFSFRTFNPENKIILSTEELASIFHLPTPFSKTPHMDELSSKIAPAPLDMPLNGLTLGYNSFRNMKTDIRIGRDDRRRHIYSIGQTGTGKSAFLSNLIEQDILNGEGVGVIDPHGDLIENILGKIPEQRLQDVVLFDPGDLERCVGLNMLEYDPMRPEQKTFIVNELINIFDKLYDLKQTGGPMFEQYAKNALFLLMDDPNETYTLIEVPRVLSDNNFRKRLLMKCRNIIVKDFWEKEAEKAGGEAALQNMVPYITSKFNTFITNDYVRPIIGQEKSTFNFRDIMDSKKILLVNLSKGKLGELNSALLGLIIVGKLTMAAFSRVDTLENNRQDFYLYIDEFQNFATDSISTILSEARKYRLCLTVSHQFIAQLHEKIRDAIFGNIGTMVAFRIGTQDGEFLEKQFEPVFGIKDLTSQDNFHFYLRLMINGKMSKPFDGKTYAPSESNFELGGKIKSYYMLKNGLDRKLVDEQIMEKLRRL